MKLNKLIMRKIVMYLHYRTLPYIILFQAIRSQSATRIVVLCERAQELTPLIGKDACVHLYVHMYMHTCMHVHAPLHLFVCHLHLIAVS